MGLITIEYHSYEFNNFSLRFHISLVLTGYRPRNLLLMAELIIVTKYQGGAGRALSIRGNGKEREDVRRNVPIHDAT